jgi:hypothetical protein
MFESKKDIMYKLDSLRESHFQLVRDFNTQGRLMLELASKLGYELKLAESKPQRWEKKGQGCHT